MSNLRKQVEALTRYKPVGLEDRDGTLDAIMGLDPDGLWLDRDDVLALLPAAVPPPAVCPACGNVAKAKKEQGATTFCVNPWHE